MEFIPGQSNIISHDVVNKTSGDSIITGTVTTYLIADTGDNAGKWFRASDSSWQATESSAGSSGFKGGSAWETVVVAAAWISGVKYKSYAKESGSLNIVYSEPITQRSTALGTGMIAWEYTVTTLGDGLPIAQVYVWVTTDSGGLNTVASGYTNTLGKLTFYLDAGTYYFWRAKGGTNFINPDTEVVS